MENKLPLRPPARNSFTSNTMISFSYRFTSKAQQTSPCGFADHITFHSPGNIRQKCWGTKKVPNHYFTMYLFCNWFWSRVQRPQRSSRPKNHKNFGQLVMEHVCIHCITSVSVNYWVTDAFGWIREYWFFPPHGKDLGWFFKKVCASFVMFKL